MTAEDEQARELRRRLDRELGGLTPRPEMLREVLAGARPDERAPAGRGGPPAWFLAAAAVLVVALAVPVLRGTVFAGPSPRGSVAASTLPTADVSPVPTRSPSAAPSAPRTRAPVTPPPASHRSTSSPSARPSATQVACPRLGLAASVGDPVDVDGDGGLDVVAVVGGNLAVDLSASGVATTPLRTAGPHAVLAVEADGRPGSELLVLTSRADGSGGQDGVLYAARGCTVGPVLNAQGKPYTFEVGSDAGDATRHGVVCSAGRLYGVTAARAADGSWSETQTPVSSATGRAVNGAPSTSTLAADDPAVQGLATATCGTATPVVLQ